MVGGGEPAPQIVTTCHQLFRFFQARLYSWKHPLRIDWGTEARGQTNQQAMPSVQIMMWPITSGNSQALWTAIKLCVTKIKWSIIVHPCGLFLTPNYSVIFLLFENQSRSPVIAGSDSLILILISIWWRRVHVNLWVKKGIVNNFQSLLFQSNASWARERE